MLKINKCDLILCIILCLFSCATSEKEIKKRSIGMGWATEEYNKAVMNYNIAVHNYNRVASKVDEVRLNGFPRSLSKLDLMEVNYQSIRNSVLQGNNTRKVYKDIDTLNQLTKIIKNNTTILRNNGTIRALEWDTLEQWIIERLKRIPDAVSYIAVTSSNDPNGLLNKKGGYVCCIYFGYGATGIFPLNEKTVIEKGTDAGGAVEVFATEEEAKARCEYLAEYDGTLLYSGSYARLENIVIRTSALLSNSQQSELTNAIVKVLTAKK